MEVTSCNKDNEEKTCLRWSAFMIDYISDYKSQTAFIGLDFEADKSRMNAELRVIMTELLLKLN